MADRTHQKQERTGTLSRELFHRVRERLGFDDVPEISTAALARVYRAWGETIPFDNAAKLVALRNNASGNLPGIDASEFFQNFLEHGVGATCWPSSNALRHRVRAKIPRFSSKERRLTRNGRGVRTTVAWCFVPKRA
ncbi:MAG TPA: hypothetical protein VF042_14215 [Gemmatimonadaceae bacterium]